MRTVDRLVGVLVLLVTSLSSSGRSESGDGATFTDAAIVADYFSGGVGIEGPDAQAGRRKVN